MRASGAVQRQLNDKLYMGCILLSAIKEGVVNMSLLGGSGPEGFDASGAWSREKNEFARRFMSKNLPGFFSRFVQVDVGTIGLYLSEGSLRKLEPARYKLGNVFSTKRDGASVVLMAESVPLSFIVSARTGNDVPISVTVETRVEVADPVYFFRKVMALSSDRVYIDEVHALLRSSVTATVQRIVSRYDVSELAGGFNITGAIDTALSSISYAGLRVSCLSLGINEGAWAGVRNERAKADVDVAAARARFERTHIIRELKTEDAVEQIHADDKIAEAQQTANHNRAVQKTLDDIEIGRIEGDARREEKRKDLDQAFNAYKRWKEILLWEKQQKGFIFDGMSVNSQIAFIDDPVAREMLFSLAKGDQNIAKSPQQILAENVTSSEDAASAIAAMSNSEMVQKLNELRLSDNQAFVEMMHSMFGEHSQQMTDVLKVAMSSMASTTTAKNTEPNQTIVTGMGVPAVVNSTPLREKSALPVSKHRHCPDCSSLLDETGECPDCGWRA